MKAWHTALMETDIDPRVLSLVAEIKAGVVDAKSLLCYRDHVISLHREVEDERSRIVLMDIHDAMGGQAERWAADDPERLDQIQKLNRGQYIMFLNVEGMADGELIDPARLGMIVDREVRRGRMSADDDFYKLAKAGEAVFGTSSAPRERGFFSRIFSR